MGAAESVRLNTRRIDIHLHDARDIRNINPQRPRDAQSTFVELLIRGPRVSLAKSQKSPIAHNQGTSPTWNKTFSFTIDDYFLMGSLDRAEMFLYVKICAKKGYFSTRRIVLGSTLYSHSLHCECS